MVASGVFSCDPGCPQNGGSLEHLIHDGIAPIMFLCLILGVAILGIYFRRVPTWGHLATYSLLTSAFALLFMVALVSSLETRTLSGLWQRLMIAVLFLWCAVVSLRAYQSPAAPLAV
jgi:FtsH-binding integral membrane protein